MMNVIFALIPYKMLNMRTYFLDFRFPIGIGTSTTRILVCALNFGSKFGRFVGRVFQSEVCYISKDLYRVIRKKLHNFFG